MLNLIKGLYNRAIEFFWSQEKPLSRRRPIIFWFGGLFCFVLFPLFLIDIGLDSYLETRKEQQKKEIFKRLNQKLELLLQYGNSRHYFHALLKRIIDLAQQSSDPVAYLDRALPHLKARNPGVFRFIVWDAGGQTVDRLTDEKSYKYIVRTLYESFAAASEDVLNNYPGNPMKLVQIDKKINLLRSYLGAFFIQERLNLPFLRGILGECIMSSSVPEKSHFWYRISDKFGFFANIHIDAIESTDYLKKLVRGLNRNQASEIKFGIAELIKDRKVFTDARLQHRGELIIELGKFMNTSENDVLAANQLLVIKRVNPFVLGFCTIPTKGNLIDVERFRVGVIAVSALLMLLVGAVIARMLFYHHFFSIRWKLALLFTYANGLPLMILGFIGFEYIQQERVQMLDQAQKRINNLLTDFDTSFVNIQELYSKKINACTEKFNRLFEKGHAVDDLIKEFEKDIVAYDPHDMVVVDQDGKFKVFRTSGRRADKFIANMGINLLVYANRQDYTPFALFKEDKMERGGKVRAQSLMGGSQIVFDEIFQRVNKVSVQQMAADERFYYWAYLGNFSKRDFRYLTMISWSQDKLQEVYLKNELQRFNQNHENIRIFAMVETTGLNYPETKAPGSVEKFFQQVFNLKIVKTDSLDIDSHDYVAFGSVGKLMNRVALVGVLPKISIDGYVRGLQLRLGLFAVLSLLLTSGIGVLLARQFLEPVRELENGVRAIGDQNFRYRIPISSADEFGHLGSVFNRAIESLEDLEVAKIVQENLFPLEPLQLNRIQVFGKSVSMTRLGGDYYDYYGIDDEYAGILMGDVAGHGVPAALLMAMAKASVLLADEEQRHSPAALLAALHKVIFRVKSSKIKRMMTCQYFAINSQTGTCKFANAGHCFPMLIRGKDRRIEQLKQVGTPLGIVKRARYQDEEIQLQNGDVVLLYTDGIIETKNAQGLEMGFERFEALVLSSFNEDLEAFYQAIFAEYLKWSPEAEDDITMVLFRYKAEEKP